MQYNIIYEPDPKPNDTKFLLDGIFEHAKRMRGFEPGKPFAFFIKDSNHQTQGGCSGFIFYGCLYVDLLWVDKSLRGHGYGTQLMQNTEKLARENECLFMAVNTMDWEALDFYKKLGFYVEFERKGFAKNSIFYFLRKELEKI